MELRITYDGNGIGQATSVDNLITANDHFKGIIYSNLTRGELISIPDGRRWNLNGSYQAQVINISDQSVRVKMYKDSEDKVIEERVLPRSIFAGYEVRLGEAFIINLYEGLNAQMIEAKQNKAMTPEDISS